MTEVTLAPRDVNLLITGRCNLSCGHCGVKSTGDDLSLPVWKEILDRLVEARVLELTLSGGEPLCRPDFPEFLKLVLDRPFRFFINTNATELRLSTAELLQNAGARLVSVMAGLDGPDEETHGFLRGSGAFHKAAKGIENAVKAGLPVTVNCTVTRKNWNRVREIADLALNTLGVQSIRFTSLLAAQSHIPAHLHCEPWMLLAAGRDLADLAGNGGSVHGTVLNMYNRALKAAEGTLPVSDGWAFSCGGCRTKLVITNTGNVIPCDYIDTFILGRLPGTSLNAIMESPEAARFRAILSKPRSAHPECARCGYLRVCTGGCPVNPLLTGNPSGKDELSCVRTLVKALKSLP